MCNLIYNIFYVLATQESQKKLKRIPTTTTLIMTRKHGKDEAKIMMMMRNKEKNLLENFADKANRIAKKI